MIRSVLYTGLFCLAASLAGSTTAEAQIGGLIKRKATEAIKGPEKKDEKQAEKSDALPDGVMEITAPVFEGVINGLKVEVALRREFRAELAKLPTQAQYDQCLSRLVSSEEYQQIQSRIGNLPENATDAQKAATMQKMYTDTEVLQKKMCPVTPNDWTEGMKQKRLAEIRTKAVQAAAPVKNARGDSDQTAEGPFLSSDGWISQSTSAPTEGEFNIHLERLDKLCSLRSEKALPTSGGFKAPGSGGKFWLFTPGELGVMDDKNCKTFEDLYKELR